MTFILTIRHGKVSAEGQNEKRGDDDSWNGCSETDDSAKISDGTVVSITDCSHRNNDKPKTIFENHEIWLIISFTERDHLTQSNNKTHVKKDKKSEGFVLKKGFYSEEKIIFSAVNSTKSAGSGIAVNGAGNNW